MMREREYRLYLVLMSPHFICGENLIIMRENTGREESVTAAKNEAKEFIHFCVDIIWITFIYYMSLYYTSPLDP